MVGDLTGDQLIQERGIPTAAEDGRAIAEVLARQLEYANAVVLSITGVGLDIRELRERLDGCVLRADEPAGTLTDPFAAYLEGSTAA